MDVVASAQRRGTHPGLSSGATEQGRAMHRSCRHARLGRAGRARPTRRSRSSSPYLRFAAPSMGRCSGSRGGRGTRVGCRASTTRRARPKEGLRRPDVKSRRWAWLPPALVWRSPTMPEYLPSPPVKERLIARKWTDRVGGRLGDVVEVSERVLGTAANAVVRVVDELLLAPRPNRSSVSARLLPCQRSRERQTIRRKGERQSRRPKEDRPKDVDEDGRAADLGGNRRVSRAGPARRAARPFCFRCGRFRRDGSVSSTTCGACAWWRSRPCLPRPR